MSETDETVTRVMALADDYAEAREDVLDREHVGTQVEIEGATAYVPVARAALESEVRAMVAVACQAHASWLVGDPMGPQLARAVEAVWGRPETGGRNVSDLAVALAELRAALARTPAARWMSRLLDWLCGPPWRRWLVGAVVLALGVGLPVLDVFVWR